MTYRTHLVGGGVAGAALLAVASPGVALTSRAAVIGAAVVAGVVLWARRMSWYERVACCAVMLVGSAIVVPGIPIVARATLLSAALIGSIAPDVDAPGAKVSRVIWPLPLLLRWTVSNPLTWVIWSRRETRRIVRHRGASHWLVAALLLSVYLWIWLTLVRVGLDTRIAPWARGGLFADALWSPTVWAGWHAAAFGVGYLSHLLLDAMTVSGVMLWGPFSQRRIWLVPKLWRVRTGR